MCKKFVISEISKLFGCSESAVWPAVKKSFIYFAGYGAVMLLTFGIAAGLTAVHAFALSGIFYFLLVVEDIILLAILSLFSIFITAYYGAFFARKGWERYSNKF